MLLNFFKHLLTIYVCISLWTLCWGLTIFEYFLVDILVFIAVVFFSYFLGVSGVFTMFLCSNIVLLIKMLSLFDLFNGSMISLSSNFGSNTKVSLIYKAEFGFAIDLISFNFSFLTCLIASFVCLYAFSYMRNEPKLILFIIFLKSFVISMVVLLWATNWFVFILGWELIGITSFFLINFWTGKISTLKSAFKAFTFNKFSDCCLILGALVSYLWGFESFYNNNLLELTALNKQMFIFNICYSVNDILLLLFILSSFCKSAQFGFHSWLPDSMEAPVPASALIHSATLVSAGIYLMIRFTPVLLASNLLTLFIFIAAFTAFYGSIISSFQTDLKKILAYSTISHCGFLMLSLTLNNSYITIFYLYGHGLFKSLSFMVVGNLIQFSNNYQDSRRMGGFIFKYLYEFFFLIICLLNLSSFPFFLNFFSKHFLFSLLSLNSYIYIASYMFIFLASYMGVFYSLKIIYLSFLSFNKGHYSNNSVYYLNFYSFFKNTNWLSLVVTFILFILSIYTLITLLTYTFNLNNFSFDLQLSPKLPDNWVVLLQNLYIKIFFLYTIFSLFIAYCIFKNNVFNVVSVFVLLFLIVFFIFL